MRKQSPFRNQLMVSGVHHQQQKVEKGIKSTVCTNICFIWYIYVKNIGLSLQVSTSCQQILAMFALTSPAFCNCCYYIISEHLDHNNAVVQMPCPERPLSNMDIYCTVCAVLYRVFFVFSLSVSLTYQFIICAPLNAKLMKG